MNVLLTSIKIAALVTPLLLIAPSLPAQGKPGTAATAAEKGKTDTVEKGKNREVPTDRADLAGEMGAMKRAVEAGHPGKPNIAEEKAAGPHGKGRPEGTGDEDGDGDEKQIGDGTPAAHRALQRAAHRQKVNERLQQLRATETHTSAIQNAQKKAQIDPLSREQRKHIQRMSRIERLSEIATEKENEELTRQVETIRKNELERHNRAMKRISEKTE